MREETAEDKKRAEELAAQWSREQKIRFAMLEIAYAEQVVLHGQFHDRNERQNSLNEAQINDCLSVVRHRTLIIEAIDKQTTVLERIAGALERGRLS